MRQSKDCNTLQQISRLCNGYMKATCSWWASKHLWYFNKNGPYSLINLNDFSAGSGCTWVGLGDKALSK